MSIKHIIYTAIKTFVPSSSSTDRRSQQPSESSEKSLTANRSCDCVTEAYRYNGHYCCSTCWSEAVAISYVYTCIAGSLAVMSMTRQCLFLLRAMMIKQWMREASSVSGVTRSDNCRDYTLCLKNTPTLKRYSSKLKGSILMTFGRNIQKTLKQSLHVSVFRQICFFINISSFILDTENYANFDAISLSSERTNIMF